MLSEGAAQALPSSLARPGSGQASLLTARKRVTFVDFDLKHAIENLLNSDLKIQSRKMKENLGIICALVFSVCIQCPI